MRGSASIFLHTFRRSGQIPLYDSDQFWWHRYASAASLRRLKKLFSSTPLVMKEREGYAAWLCGCRTEVRHAALRQREGD